jgi:hypothetical protein
VKPDVSGRMPFADNSFDLTSLGVLHRIPNVSVVVSDMARCTKPLGWQLVCEPTHSMGNWERPRRLLTPHERGIPPAIPFARSLLMPTCELSASVGACFHSPRAFSFYFQREAMFST